MRSSPEDDAVNAQVFIQFGPMNTTTAPGQAEIPALRKGGMGEARIPIEWHGDRPTVVEDDSEVISSDLDELCAVVV